MRLQEHGFGEFGKKLLVDFRVPDHFHRLLARWNVLVVGLPVAFPYDAVEHDADFLPAGVLVERSGDQARRDLLMQIHRGEQFAERENKEQRSLDILAIFPCTPLFRGSQESDLVHALLDLKTEILEHRGRRRQQFFFIARLKEPGLHGPVHGRFCRQLQQLGRLRVRDTSGQQHDRGQTGSQRFQVASPACEQPLRIVWSCRQSPELFFLRRT